MRVAGGVTVSKDGLDVGGRDFGILFGCAGKETDGTSVRRLLIVFDAVSETAIPCEVKRGDVVSTPRASGFGWVPIELGFAVLVFGCQDKVRSLWRQIYQGTNGFICVANSSDRSLVVDAKDDFNKVFDDELRDAVVLPFANTSTPFTGQVAREKLISGHRDKDLWLGCADDAGDDSVTGGKGQSPTSS